MQMFGRRFPLFLYLLRPAQNKAALTVPMLIHLLKAKFSEEGSNSLTYEKAVYGKFVKYVREVASGRRVTSLENILEFVPGASEEPTLGFDQQPCIEFVLATVKEAKIDHSEDGTGNNSTHGERSRKKRAMQISCPSLTPVQILCIYHVDQQDSLFHQIENYFPFMIMLSKTRILALCSSNIS
ncbi:PREDICTED: uncharacterized protein LOC107346812 [Acropora digitifera]|uniref:uncharacterized protein LOC107346812 n=1 Tax=Acropora digitifera TaxID=70779 RepID=UPI000779F94D|nr:PREDICTED: uncharacterized protein LOC107346812 [Acropora digitifera]